LDLFKKDTAYNKQ